MNNELILRLPDISDLDELMIWENDHKKSNHTDFPMFYARDQMITYLNSNHDLFLQNQQRWIIQLDDVLVGCVDLYDFDMVNSRAGVGIYIVPEYRGKGLAREALVLIKKRLVKSILSIIFLQIFFLQIIQVFNCLSMLGLFKMALKKLGLENKRIL